MFDLLYFFTIVIVVSFLPQSFVEKQLFFEKYESLLQSLKQSADALVNADSSGELSILHTFVLEITCKKKQNC